MRRKKWKQREGRKFVLFAAWMIVLCGAMAYELCVARELLRLRIEQKIANIGTSYLRLRQDTKEGENFLREGKYHFRVPITITAYPPLQKCTDKTPLETASGARVAEGVVALSKDLEQRYKFRFDEKLHIAGIGGKEKKMVFQDRMNPKWKNRADVFMWSEERCRRFGVMRGTLICERTISQKKN